MSYETQRSADEQMPSMSPRRTRVRFFMLGLIAVGTLINYLDRAVLGIAAPAMAKDLALSPAVMGIVFSAFAWTYTASQIPGGVLLDKIGSRLTYLLSLISWSLFTLFHAFAGSLSTLIGLRLGLGVSESPCFPTNSRIVATWLPQQERARGTSIYTVGEYVGLAFLSPLLYWIMARYSWHAVFIFTGGIGLLFAVAWALGYRDPQHCARVNRAELDYIAAGGGLEVTAGPAIRFSWGQVRSLLSHRSIWGICLGQFAGNTTLNFFLTWFPSYLVTERHMPGLKVGFMAMLPFVAASIGVIFGGWWSDGMLRRGKSANVARKLPIIIGLLLASTIIAANFVEDQATVIAIMSVAFFAQGMASLGWTLVSDIAPKGMLGLTGGVFNVAANLAGIIAPLAIGFIVQASGSYVGALVFVGLTALVGAAAYIFAVGDIRRIEMKG